MKKFHITVNGNAYEVDVEEIGAAAPAAAPVAAPAAAPAAPAAAGATVITCPMPGTIVDVKVAAGDVVAEGQLPEGVGISKTLLQSIARRLFYLEVKNRTEPAIDIAALQSDPTLRGAFYQALSPLLSGTPEEKALAEKALRYGLLSLSGNDIIDFQDEA